MTVIGLVIAWFAWRSIINAIETKQEVKQEKRVATWSIETWKVIIWEVELYAKEVTLKKQKQQILNDLWYYETALFMKWIYTWDKVEILKKIDMEIIDARAKRADIINATIKYDKVLFQ